MNEDLIIWCVDCESTWEIDEDGTRVNVHIEPDALEKIKSTGVEVSTIVCDYCNLG